MSINYPDRSTPSRLVALEACLAIVERAQAFHPSVNPGRAQRAVAVAQRQVVTGMRCLVPPVHRASGGLLIVAGLYAGWYGTCEPAWAYGRPMR